MRSIRFFLLSAMLFFSGACVSAEKDKPVNICGNGLSCEEVKDLAKDALDGSQEAAMELFWSSLDEGRKEDSLFWAQVAMENGSQAGRHNYASLLSDKSDARSLIRARFHLRLLVRSGDKDAEALLDVVERKIERIQSLKSND